LVAGPVLALGYVVGCGTTSSSSSGPADPFAVSRGAYLVGSLIDCGGCHTSDPSAPFGGGTQFPIDDAGHYVYSRNITTDPATGMTLTQDQFVEMMQTGKDFRNPGQSLLVMPWPNFRWMTVGDLQAIYQFLQVLPTASNAVPADNKGPLASQGPVPLPTEYNEGEETRPLPPTNSPDPLGAPDASTATPDPGNAVLGAAILPLAYAKMPNFYNRTPEEQASFGRGSYLVNAAACGECHTNVNGNSRSVTPGPTYLQIPAAAYLIGGTTYSVPPTLNTVLGETRSMSQNLVGAMNGYFNDPTTYESFLDEITALAHTDDANPLPLGWPMPADLFRTLAEQDLIDIYTYMKILTEDYDHTGQADTATQDPARYCTTAAQCQSGQTCFVDSSSAKTVNNQCLTSKCMVDSDCNTCQTCTNNTCQAPAATSTCITQGI
jgi:hypothetical protein